MEGPLACQPLLGHRVWNISVPRILDAPGGGPPPQALDPSLLSETHMRYSELAINSTHAQEEERNLIQVFEQRRKESLDFLMKDEEDGDVDDATMAGIANAISAANMIPGTLQPLDSTGDPKLWMAHAVAGLAHTRLALAYNRAFKDVGTDTLRYKVPKPGVEKPTSKIWSDQTCQELRLHLAGRIVIASCSLATGSKLVRAAGDFGSDLAAVTGDTKFKFFAIPTSSMLNPLASDRVPGWMVRALKPSEDGSVLKTPPTMEPITQEFTVAGTGTIPTFKIQHTYLQLKQSVQLAPGDTENPVLLELTREMFPEELRPFKRQRPDEENLDDPGAVFLLHMKKMARHLLA